MMIIPACCLSPSDLALLGNNLLPTVSPRRTRSRGRHASMPANHGDDDHHHCLDAVNRSLAGHGESVARLYPIAPAMLAVAERPISAA
jgi:hypothetical protein